MRAYVFHSVHERIFDGVTQRLQRAGWGDFGALVWGTREAEFLSQSPVSWSQIDVFTRDVLANRGTIDGPGLERLERKEREYGVGLNRVITAERHLRTRRSHQDLLTILLRTFDLIEKALDRFQPDLVFSEDVSGQTSYALWLVARARSIPFYCIANARLPNRVMVYRDGLQRWSEAEALFAMLRSNGLDPHDRTLAEDYISSFRAKPHKPRVMTVRSKMPVLSTKDFGALRRVANAYYADPTSPVVTHPGKALGIRARRVFQASLAKASKVYDTPPPPGSKYVAYPMHFQPEATTLVQAPLYLDQASLIENIATSLPIGYHLVVKDHPSARGRWPLHYLQRLADNPSVRLIGPDEDSWALLKGAAAVATITGTMGWEAHLFDKPSITFGDVFYNALPATYQAREWPKDRWYDLFVEALADRTAAEGEKRREDLLCFLAALLRTTDPGFMRNARRFSWALEPENLDNLSRALIRATSPRVDGFRPIRREEE